MKKNEFAMMTARVNIDFISVLFRKGGEWDRERRAVPVLREESGREVKDPLT